MSGKSRLSLPLKYHGGQFYTAKRIVALMPEHLHYVEPYAGGLSVLFAKDPENTSEVVNDIYRDLTNFWKVLQGLTSFASFMRLVEATPFSELEWSDARLELDEWPEPDEAVSEPVIRAWKFFVVCRQSLAGRMKNFTSVTKTRTRRGMNNEVSAWLSAIQGLPEVHQRLQRVLILNQDALSVIQSHDTENTLFYLDPPFLQETRTSPAVYKHEMTTQQHQALLTLLLTVKGKVMLSGYPSDLYENMLLDWRCESFEMPNHASGASEKRSMTACLWMNF